MCIVFLFRILFTGWFNLSGCVLLQDYLGGIIVFVAIITGLLTASVYPDTTAPSLVGLAINYTLLVPIYLNWVVKLLSDMEMYIGAVERVSHYIEGEQQQPNVAAGSHHKEKCKSYILADPFTHPHLASFISEPPTPSSPPPFIPAPIRSLVMVLFFACFSCCSTVYSLLCSVILFYFICDLTMISISTEMGIEIGLWIEGGRSSVYPGRILLCQCCPSVNLYICRFCMCMCACCTSLCMSLRHNSNRYSISHFSGLTHLLFMEITFLTTCWCCLLKAVHCLIDIYKLTFATIRTHAMSDSTPFLIVFLWFNGCTKDFRVCGLNI